LLTKSIRTHRCTEAGYRRGYLAMANHGPNTNGSQFFILHQDYPLPPDYVIFAKVTAGLETVDMLGNTVTTMDESGELSKPLQPPVIKKITIRP
jgi:cyclophilin family peptidyl-prolyl cis-trans isomerase